MLNMLSQIIKDIFQRDIYLKSDNCNGEIAIYFPFYELRHAHTTYEGRYSQVP
jgi:hypothetical protein